jgi:hypothetical protein
MMAAIISFHNFNSYYILAYWSKARQESFRFARFLLAYIIIEPTIVESARDVPYGDINLQGLILRAHTSVVFKGRRAGLYYMSRL